jgi:hypothetical protein
MPRLLPLHPCRFWVRPRPWQNAFGEHGGPAKIGHPDLLSPWRCEGHSALRCRMGLPWRNMFTPTKTAGTAQTIQLAL